MEQSTKTPRYAEILKALQNEIALGEHAVGTLLPSEASLCKRFGVSRFTVREALRRLQEDGLVSRVQGAGSRVLRDTPSGVFVQNYRSMSDLTQNELFDSGLVIWRFLTGNQVCLFST